ncbi:thermonuclease family protein [Leucothrix pacifica]|uniref:thermonuclease family protein n=1 Tax=Leucothrix pacifica TaxID=1247513 RepID=UPI001C642910|nr:thermonuclease family protein [Leucothrix pacifica]
MKFVKYVGVVLALTVLAVVLQFYNGYRDHQEQCNLQGKVVKLADGDSITVLDDDKVQHKIRLSGIDAPERNQPYGKAAKQFLSDKIFGKTVCVGWYKKDKYRRLVGVVRINDQDVNYQLVEAGLAWHYKYYQKEQSAYDRVKYAEAQEQAEDNKRGLWQERKPITPWDWRKGERE